MPLLLLLLLLISTPVWAVTTLYVSTGGSGSACTSGSPCSLDTAKGLAAPGDTITLDNGTYGETTISCGSGAQNGTSGSPITLKATNERQAHLHDDGSYALDIINCSYWSVEGIRFSGADVNNGDWHSVVDVIVSTHLTFKRNIFDHDNRYNNVHLLDLNCDNCLVEENEFYYFHRHGLHQYYGNNNVIRRNYLHSRDWADIVPGGYPSGPDNRGDEGISVYPGSNNIMENNIVEDVGSAFTIDSSTDSIGNQYYGNIALSNVEGWYPNARSNTLASMPQDTVIRDSIAILGSGIGFRFPGNKNTQCTNCSSIGNASNGYYSGVEGGLPGDGAPTVFLTNSLALDNANFGFQFVDQSDWGVNYGNVYNSGTAFDPNDGHITNSTTGDPGMGTCYAWVPDASPMKGAGLSGSDVGATILYRYQDGAISTVPLWDTTTGAFPCGAIVTGLNDSAGDSCSNVQERLHINQGGCSFPASYAVTGPDYRLQATSPLRNAAQCLSTVLLDIVGYARGSACDMGAYEFQSGEAIGTIAKYLFSEGSGLTVADSTGQEHTGTFSPDAGWTTGRIGPYAGLFDGTRYVSIPGVSQLRPTTEASIGVWFKATTVDVGGSALVALPNDGLMPYLTSLGKAACQLYDELGHFITITSSGSYLDDAWNFLTCSYLKGDGLYLRVNHTQVGFTSLSTNISYTIGGTENVELGRSSGSPVDLNFVGSLDHITLKDVACDSACDLALYQEGSSQRRIMVMGVR